MSILQNDQLKILKFKMSLIQIVQFTIFSPLFLYTSTLHAATFVYSPLNTKFPISIGTVATLTYVNVTHKI